MALNKSMHARNRYKDKPPDFAYLASKYPDFKQHVQINLTGRVSLNFKDPEAVRALTCTLLKEDFGLSIDIPLERLIPTVPLRLNYIHWVEDLIGPWDPARSALRRGIDIGTGASCIYPLLGATLNGWYFLATEVDDMCFNYAKKNVEQNNLSDLIKVVKVPQKTLLMDALKEESEIIYDFCMCNPPFFANQLEAKGVNSRNPRRPPPSSVNTGGITEIMAEGGELEFVKRIIHDSLQLKKRLRWYSCMLGKKCSLAPLKEELRIQGSPPSKRRKLEKPRKPITFVVLAATMKELSLKASAAGSETVEGIAVITTWLEKILTDLKVQHKRVPCGKEEVSLFLTAVENSWVHLRRKKRDRVRQLREVPRASEDFIQAMEEEKPMSKEIENNPDGSKSTDESSPLRPAMCGTETTVSKRHHPDQGDSSQEPMEEGTEKKGRTENLECSRGSLCATEELDASEEVTNTVAQKEKNSTGTLGHYLFKCLINVKKEANDDTVVEMHWVEGQNRDLMNQLCTYLRNQIFRLVAS
ncbi:RNA N6-adenosine-methyltransferase METTL16 isoform X2 [Monodelphis domestica]|uniref:RNA N6-adenosine-methyltransferase METTL16 isoform X2 n=1 Tax=Monodelphis domestica TaxID=13616 RepID=UPI0000D92455|nr:RNA N6-adenosine-methyltransferase METTL16 isoform X2 [Monodelphis domestica]